MRGLKLVYDPVTGGVVITCPLCKGPVVKEVYDKLGACVPCDEAENSKPPEEYGK